MGLFGKGKSPEEKALALFIQNHFGFKPKDMPLYQQALRHKSAATEIKKGLKDSNERLEFLGDAILDSIVADFLYDAYPFNDEGFLTKLRSRIVSRSHLNALASHIGLDKFLEVNLHQSVKHKSLNGNALEALIGAIYLEKGYAFTRKSVITNLLDRYVNLKNMEKTETNHKSRLLEWAQKERLKVTFVVVFEEDLGYQKRYEVQVEIKEENYPIGKGTSKKEAEQEAARLAWDVISKMPPEGEEKA